MSPSGGGASRQLECQGVEQLSNLSKEKFRHPELVSGSQHRWTLKALRFFRLHPQNGVNYHVENILESFKCKVLNDLTSYRLNVFKKTAFTLAEVLITLGIIGVVATLTMPTLIKNHYKRTVEVQLAKTYAELQDAIKRSELDNGSFKYWDYEMASSSEFAKKYILPYLDPNWKSCQGWVNSPCFKNKWSYTLPNGVYYDFDHHWPRFKYNGRTMAFKITVYNGNCTSDFPGICTTPKFVDFTIDVDGDKGPSILGLDVHHFVLVNYIRKTNWGGGPTGEYYGLHSGSTGGLYAHYKDSDESVKGMCAAADTSLQHPKQCTILLHRNNWKFPKDYPIKF